MSLIRYFILPALFFPSCFILPSISRADSRISIAASDFTDGRHEQYQMLGDAALSEDLLKLNQNDNWTSGSAFYKDQISLHEDGSFSAYFTFSMKQPVCSKGGKGADGIAFMLKSKLDSTIGEKGRGIGYGGITPSVAVEFDTFLNGEFTDPNDNHVGVNFNGNMTSVATETAPFQLNNGELYHAWVDYDGTKDLLEVRLDTSAQRPIKAVFTRTLDLPAIIGPDVYVGFTAATGLCKEIHSIHSFFFNSDLVPGGIDLLEDTYSDGFGAD